MDATLEAIAARLLAIAADLEAGHTVDPSLIETEVRRILAQAEMIAKGLDRE